MNIKDTIESVRKQFRTDSDPFPDDNDKIDSLKIKYLGRKGLIANLFTQMNQVEAEDRPLFGKYLNQLKNEINSKRHDGWTEQGLKDELNKLEQKNDKRNR